jgi:hypothetical protein
MVGNCCVCLMSQAASGIPTKMFDAAVAKVLNSDSNAGARCIRDEGERRVQRSFAMSNQDAYALSFLDIFFQGIMLSCNILMMVTTCF